MKITVLDYDDWKAVYFDDELIDQNHSVDWRFVLEQLAKRGCIDSFSLDSFDEEGSKIEDYVSEEGEFPQSLSKYESWTK